MLVVYSLRLHIFIRGEEEEINQSQLIKLYATNLQLIPIYIYVKIFLRINFSICIKVPLFLNGNQLQFLKYKHNKVRIF